METTLQRLLDLGQKLPNLALRQEQRELVNSLARNLNISLESQEEPPKNESNDAAPEEPNKKSTREDVSPVSSGREKFQKQEQNNAPIRREARKSAPVRPPSSTSPSGSAECDISNPDIKNAYVFWYITNILHTYSFVLVVMSK